MRQAVLLPIALIVTLFAWRVGALVAAGHRQHAKELAARVVMESILRAEESRRLQPPRTTSGPIYAYLSELVADARNAELKGLTPVADSRVEIFRAGDYLFHVSLLSRSNRPLRLPTADRGGDTHFGLRFEAWAWPADPVDTQLVLYFASTGGTLLQGENGIAAGATDFPGDQFASESPLQQHERDGERDLRWLEVFSLERE